MKKIKQGKLRRKQHLFRFADTKEEVKSSTDIQEKIIAIICLNLLS